MKKMSDFMKREFDLYMVRCPFCGYWRDTRLNKCYMCDYISNDKEANMSATKRFVEDKIEEFAVKYGIGYDDLMKAYNAMNEIGIKCDFNNFEKKLIRFYHYAQVLKLLEDDI